MEWGETTVSSSQRVQLNGNKLLSNNTPWPLPRKGPHLMTQSSLQAEDCELDSKYGYGHSKCLNMTCYSKRKWITYDLCHARSSNRMNLIRCGRGEGSFMQHLSPLYCILPTLSVCAFLFCMFMYCKPLSLMQACSWAVQRQKLTNSILLEGKNYVWIQPRYFNSFIEIKHWKKGSTKWLGIDYPFLS